MIERVGLELTDMDIALIKSGELVRTNGILRNAETMEIVKHLPIVDLDSLSCWDELGKAISRVSKENKKGIIIGASVIVVAATVVGGYAINKRKKKKEKDEMCDAWLNSTIQNYITSASNGELNLETIEACESALISLPYITDKVFVSMTKNQIVDFMCNLNEYTRKLAEVHNYELQEGAFEHSDNVITCFIDNLRLQKDILSSAA